MPTLQHTYNVMTPGPTNIHPDVLKATARNYTNPDLDHDFVNYYKRTAEKLNTFLNNDGKTYLLCGEGILGLEAACMSFIESGDRVLTLSNGIFGKGFGDFSKMAGGNVDYYESDPRQGLDAEAIETFIIANGPYKIATVVHCETPSGLTNDLSLIGPLLRKHGILSIVDSVSAIGGEALDMKAWQLDVVLGGSQKVVSAPPGMTMVSLSLKALDALSNRETPILGFYNNLQIWKNYEINKWFPYTQPTHQIAGLSAAFDRLMAYDSIGHHARVANAVRGALKASGFELFAQSAEANTVTTVMLPDGLDFRTLFDCMKHHHQTLIGGGFDFLDNKVFRIGHMGENADISRVRDCLKALEASFETLNVTTYKGLTQAFDALI